MSQKAADKLKHLSQNGIQITQGTVKSLDGNISSHYSKGFVNPTCFPSSEERVEVKVEIIEDEIFETNIDIKPPITIIKTEPISTNQTLEIEYEPEISTCRNSYADSSIKIEDKCERTTPEYSDSEIKVEIEIHEDQPQLNTPSISGTPSNEKNVSKHNKYNCDVCNLKFQRQAALMRHSVVHTGNKPFSCTLCDKTYFTKGHLKRHLLFHTGERSYPCTKCDKTFTQSGHLSQHMKIHIGVKPYACDRCTKSFFRRAELVNHMHAHSEEYPSTCTLCNKKLTSLNRYKNHIVGDSAKPRNPQVQYCVSTKVAKIRFRAKCTKRPIFQPLVSQKN